MWYNGLFLDSYIGCNKNGGFKKMKILLLGKNGQIGWELRRTLAPQGEVIALGRAELDLEDGVAIRKMVRHFNPNIIVNAAAYNGVEQAEVEPEKARLVNAIAPGILAEEAKRANALLVHYSTDYVFDGAKDTAYTEEDQARPLNVYGQTKLEGEQNIIAVGASHLILRTLWIYGARGKNFLLTMLKLAGEKDELRVVDDQFGSPTWSRMVAEATAQLLPQIKNNLEEIASTYNLCAGGQTSWYGFARAIFEQHFSPEDNYARVIPIPSSEFKTRAERPSFSVLSCDKLLNDFAITLPQWDHTLPLVLENCR